jgi:hypothetical protein
VPVRWRELQDKLKRATSLRAFYYEAIKRPQDGGYFYAMSALDLCRKLPPADAAATAHRRDVAERLRQRCDFSEQETEDALRQFTAIRHAGLTDDPLYGRIFGLLMANTPDARMAAVHAAIDAGNPEVIAAVASPSIEVEARTSLGANADAIEDKLQYATVLTSCRLGSDCGPDGLLAQYLCANKGWCGGDVPDALQAALGTDYAVLDRLSQQAVANIRSGNLARLARTPWAPR